MCKLPDDGSSYNETGVGRCEKDSVKNFLDDARDYWLLRPTSLHYEAAERYDIRIAVNNDNFAADVYYHKVCYNRFVYVPKDSLDHSEIEKVYKKVLEHFLRKIERRVIKDNEERNCK